MNIVASSSSLKTNLKTLLPQRESYYCAVLINLPSTQLFGQCKRKELVVFSGYDILYVEKVTRDSQVFLHFDVNENCQ